MGDVVRPVEDRGLQILDHRGGRCCGQPKMRSKLHASPNSLAHSTVCTTCFVVLFATETVEPLVDLLYAYTRSGSFQFLMV